MRKESRSKATACLEGQNMIDLGDLRPDPIEIREYKRTRKTRRPLFSIGTGIVLAAIIGVSGFWGGKIGYELFHEWRAKQAMQELAQAAQRHAQAQAQQRRLQAQRAAQARRDQVWNSRACRFWWERAPNDPQVIAKARTMQSCQMQ